jgi:hypothetical protein
MQRFIVAVPLALVLLAADAGAQQEAVHFKTLQQALPSGELAGFTREKPTGSMQKTMGMAMSEASVRYVKAGSADGNVSVTAKVADMVGLPFMGGLAMIAQMNQESETETSRTKTVTVKKYKGSEETSTGQSKSCKLTIPVANRFMVELDGSNTSDVKLLYALVDSMALDKLEASAASK